MVVGKSKFGKKKSLNDETNLIGTIGASICRAKFKYDNYFLLKL